MLHALSKSDAVGARTFLSAATRNGQTARHFRCAPGAATSSNDDGRDIDEDGVHASQHKSQAALETRVHIEATSKRKRYSCIGFHFDESMMKILSSRDLPKGWNKEPSPPSVKRIGDDWIKSGDSVILAVPSVIVAGELNLLINPKHPDFGKIEIDKPADFVFDERLFE